jgi:hypothetical protein
VPALVAERRSNAVIARRLVISEKAVVSHILRIYDQLALIPSEDDQTKPGRSAVRASCGDLGPLTLEAVIHTLTFVNRRRYAAGLGAVAVALVLLACGSPGAAFGGGNPMQGSFSGPISIGGGRKLYLRCAGRGTPTVVLDAGLHESSDSWTLTHTEFPVPSSPSVLRGVARFTHACIYDRPGTIRQSLTQPPP